MNWLDTVKEVFDKEIDAAERTKESLDTVVAEVCRAIDDCQGYVVTVGMGKSGYICKKIAATMNSIGIKAHFLHPAEAMHGDLGVLNRDDIIIAISKSGETEELLQLLPHIKKMGIPVYSLIGRSGSAQEKYSTATIVFPPFPEAFLGTMVPTSSTTVALMMGDALAVAVAEKRGFTKENFSNFHPHGQLGKQMTLKVKDLMLAGEENAVVFKDATVGDAVFEMCKKSVGGVNIIAPEGTLIGVFTDGDLRRLHNRFGSEMDTKPIVDVMTPSPITFDGERLVADVVDEIKKFDRQVSFYPVVTNGVLVGSLRAIEIAKSGL